MPYFFATCAVESWLPPTSDVTSTSGMRLSASRCFCPNAPCPATQIFIVTCSYEPLISRARRRASILPAAVLACPPTFRGAAMRLQNDVADRGVRRGHGVEAIDLVDLVVERAAHDQPHHHLDAFGAGLAHVFDVRNAGELLRVLGQIVEEGLVPFAVDQAGARARKSGATCRRCRTPRRADPPDRTRPPCGSRGRA